MSAKSAAGRNLERPPLSQWRNWSESEYLAHLLSRKAVRARLRGERPVAARLSAEEFREFCRPIRERFGELFHGVNCDIMFLPKPDQDEFGIPLLDVGEKLRDVRLGQE